MLPTSISLARWNRKEAEYIGFECFAEKNESATRRTKGGGTLFLPRRGKLVSAKLISKHGYRRQRVWGRGLCSSWTQERGGQPSDTVDSISKEAEHIDDVSRQNSWPLRWLAVCSVYFSCPFSDLEWPARDRPWACNGTDFYWDTIRLAQVRWVNCWDPLLSLLMYTYIFLWLSLLASWLPPALHYTQNFLVFGPFFFLRGVCVDNTSGIPHRYTNCIQ